MDPVYRGAIIACVVLIAVAGATFMGMSVLPAGPNLRVLALGIQIGCLIAIIRALTNVVAYRNSLGNQVQDAIDNLPKDACPDMWVRKSASKSCGNTFTTPSGKFMYVIGKEQDQTVPITHKIDVTLKSCSGPEKDYPFEYLRTLCTALKLQQGKKATKTVCRSADSV